VSRLLIDLPDELVDAIADKVLDRLNLNVATPDDDGFLDVAGAARFLACPKSRIYAAVSARSIPFHKDGSRLLFDRAELRAHVHNGGAKRT
jgi:excisionase family DNA binding protein